MVTKPGDYLTYRKYVMRDGVTQLYLSPGGYLCAILVAKEESTGELKFTLTDEVGLALFGEFPLSIMLTCGGMMLDNLPNMSSVNPYRLNMHAERPYDVEVIAVHRLDQRA
jgi:hypothetical protein